MADKFLIAPFEQNSGLRTNVKPWLIPDNACSVLRNVYVFRGRFRKRFGSKWIGNSPLSSKLRWTINDIDGQGRTDGAGNAASNVTIIAVTDLPYFIGAQFSIGDVIFTVIDATPGAQPMLRSDGLGGVATFNAATGAYVINGVAGGAGQQVYFYPGLPVMGLLSFESPIRNDEPTYAFDTKYSYFYQNTGWERFKLGTANWAGTDSDFFQAVTWRGVNSNDRLFFVTNGNIGEPNFMRYLNTAQTWVNFAPLISAGNYLIGCGILAIFKNRMLAFDTYENNALSPLGATRYGNRVRWCQVGSPVEGDAWQQDIPGKGSGLDATTFQNITSVTFIRDRCIVEFERSTWELVYTGNQTLPFQWQLINEELGAESRYASVPFDQVALGVGNVGIIAANSNSVERVDNNIPDLVFEIHNDNQGVTRVYGIRDYYTEMVYWTFPSITSSDEQPYPNRILVYNYKNSTWAINDDTITCFGYFQNFESVLWSSTTVTFSAPLLWGGASNQGRFRNVIAGNQQGYTFLIDSNVPVNASVLAINDIPQIDQPENRIWIACINHNLRIGEYVFISRVTGTGNVTLLNNKIFKVESVPDRDLFTFIYNKPDINGNIPVIAGVYSGAGLIARVSQIQMNTKEFNFYAKQGKNACINQIDFMVTKTNFGEFVVNYYASTNLENLLTGSAPGTGTGALLGTGVVETSPYALYPMEAQASRLWHPVYISAEGEVIQLEITMNDEQMQQVIEGEFGELNGATFEDFELHAFCITASPGSERFE